MSAIDWVVFGLTLFGILGYGMWRGRGQHDADAYLRADRSLPWYVVLLGVMATQASAITFLSAPGQAFTDGMRFVQYYFGLPIAMVVICVTFIPIFRKQNVFTAYEFLEKRFDRKTRVVTSVLFLLSRGLSTGISIYAPSIIVASIMGWNIYLTNTLVGGLLLLYTVRGGARAVAHTQTLMFGIILASMVVAALVLVGSMPNGMGFTDALTLAGASGSLNVITFSSDPHDKYNLISGLVGGFFLALSYFGTDQSQVGRFITGKNTDESRRGLLLNGIVKIPMQFGILFIGALLVALYSVVPSPIFFNESVVEKVRTVQSQRYEELQSQWSVANAELARASNELLTERRGNEFVAAATSSTDTFLKARNELRTLRAEFKDLVKQQGIAESSDTNYIFLHFVRTMLPVGLVGLIFAVVILASWGSISAAFHSLATASLVDLHLLFGSHNVGDVGTVHKARLHTFIWGIFCIAVSMLATRMGSLIEAVNILGSLFYGPILGIFLVAFYIRRARGTIVFIAAILAEVVVITCYAVDVVSFLWLNVIGAGVVVLVCLPASLRAPRLREPLPPGTTPGE
ncbi:MAG: sodium:solute symporter [Candidatus Kapabacteria bacterium]|nr:sodium:solute symporter [Ignavibacteria bacterium]MBK9181625.1 sodium:solute symporter [Ignavibacteria bacterium]MBP6510215.1 sodium:solute symporter [Candidatus Kapabacteria bacterium]